jgi:3-phytase
MNHSKIYILLSILLSLMMIFGCTSLDRASYPEKKSLRCDRGYNLSMKKQAAIHTEIKPIYETVPVNSPAGEDAADDPAIWYNPNNPQESRIIGTNKKGGLHVYNLQGKELQFIPAGLINNVDLRDGFIYQADTIVLVAGTNRSDNTISFFALDHISGLLSERIYTIQSSVNEVYGITLHHDKKYNAFYVFVNGKNGNLEGYSIEGGAKMNHHKTHAYAFGMQPEGMVVDDENHLLYIGVERKGIFQLDLKNKLQEPILLPGSNEANPAISFDIEGIALFSINQQSFLLASSQGNFSYAIFKLGDDAKYLSSFIISSNQSIDGVEETDGRHYCCPGWLQF